MKTKKFDTKAIHGGEENHFPEGAHSCPIYQTSTFLFSSVDEARKAFSQENENYMYTRLGNPTQKVLQTKV